MDALKANMQDFKKTLKKIFFYEKSYVVFVMTFVTGFFLHSVMITNVLYNHDSMTLPFNNGDWLLTQGKWFVTPIVSLYGPLEVQSSGVFIGLIALALCAMAICGYFDIKNKLLRFMIGLILVSFPSFTTETLYHATDYFCIAFLLGVVGAFLITSGGIATKILGIILASLSLGAYQANISTIMVIVAADILVRVLNNQRSKEIVKECFIDVISVIGSLMLYYVVLKIRLFVKQVDLSDYKNISNMGDNIKPSTFFHSAEIAYKCMVDFFLRGDCGIYGDGYTVWGALFILIMLFTAFVVARKNGILKNMNTYFWLFAFTLLFPLCVNAIGVLSANLSFYYISIQAFSLVYCLSIILMSLFESSGGLLHDRIGKCIYYCGIAIALTICFRWSMNNNVVYQKLFMINHAYDIKVATLMGDIHGTKGYSSDMDVIFVGEPPYTFLESGGALSYFETQLDTSTGYFLGNADGMIYSEGILDNLLKNKCSEKIMMVSNKDLDNETLRKVEQMPIYPSEGSLQTIEGRMIVKLSDKMEDQVKQ